MYSIINDINKNVFEYNYGNTYVLLLNSNLFGCGLNLEITTDILFLHKTPHDLQTQIIGRAQRPGRKNKLYVWFIMHENENYYKEPINQNFVQDTNIDNLFEYENDINIIKDDNDEKVTIYPN